MIDKFVCGGKRRDLTKQERHILKVENLLADEPDDFMEWLIIHHPDYV